MLEGRRPAELAGLRDAPIVGAVPGLYGGIAYDNSAYLAYSNRWSQASLWRAPFRRERLEADNLWHGYRAPRLVSYATYTPLLLDARELLPFAGTWGRVDDTYFLMLLRAIAAPVLFAHLPVALGHVDLAPRQRLAHAQQPLRDRLQCLTSPIASCAGAPTWRRAPAASVCWRSAPAARRWRPSPTRSWPGRCTRSAPG